MARPGRFRIAFGRVRGQGRDEGFEMAVSPGAGPACALSSTRAVTRVNKMAHIFTMWAFPVRLEGLEPPAFWSAITGLGRPGRPSCPICPIRLLFWGRKFQYVHAFQSVSGTQAAHRSEKAMPGAIRVGV